MELTIKPIKNYCDLQEFTINGKKATWKHFGDSYDADKANAKEWCCANRIFKRCEADKYILKWYGISKREYNDICDKLEEVLSIGKCDRCKGDR